MRILPLYDVFVSVSSYLDPTHMCNRLVSLKPTDINSNLLFAPDYHRPKTINEPACTRSNQTCVRPMQSIYVLPRHPRQQRPQPHTNNQHGQHDRLQDLHALGLGDGADGKGQDAGATAAERGGEADGAHVEVFGEELGGGDDGGGEERAEEEAQEGDGDGGDEEVREQPED